MDHSRLRLHVITVMAFIFLPSLWANHGEALDPASPPTEKLARESSNSDPTPPAAPTETEQVKLEREQKEKSKRVEAALKDPKALTAMLTDSKLENALKDKDDSKLAEALGLEKNDPKLQQFRVRALAENDFDRFAAEIKEMEKKGEVTSDYDKALKAEAQKLLERHGKLAAELASRTGDSRASLALQLEKWQRLVDNDGKLPTEKNGKKVAVEMAGFLRSVHDRKGLETAVKAMIEESDKGPKGEPKYGILSYFEMGTDLTNRFPTDVPSRLAKAFPIPNSAQGQFARQFMDEWPKHLEALKIYGEMRNAAVQVGPNGEYKVDADAMKKLRDAYPTLTPEWAAAVGDRQSLWAAGYDTTKEEWKYASTKSIWESSTTLFTPVTLTATSPYSLNSFLDSNAKAGGNPSVPLAQLATQSLAGRFGAPEQPALTALTGAAAQTVNAFTSTGSAALNLDSVLLSKNDSKRARLTLDQSGDSILNSGVPKVFLPEVSAKLKLLVYTSTTDGTFDLAVKKVVKGGSFSASDLESIYRKAADSTTSEKAEYTLKANRIKSMYRLN